jgi:hypothetical protein
MPSRCTLFWKFVMRGLPLYPCLLSAFVLLCGCGKGSERVFVGGTVAYGDKPLPTAALTFYPNSGRPVTAPVSDQGQYQTELLPGEYVVTVNLSTQLPPGFKEGDPLPPPPIVLPQKYTNKATSTLTATVVPGQSEPIDFALE